MGATWLTAFAAWVTADRRDPIWAACFIVAILVAVGVGGLLGSPEALVLGVSILAIAITVAVMIGEDEVSVASMAAFAIGTYAYCAQISAMGDGEAYWWALAFVAAILALALTKWSGTQTHKQWMAIAFLVILFAAMGLTLWL